MIKKVLKRFSCMALCGLLLGSSLTVMAKDKITPSTKNYGVNIQGSKNLYLCNKQPVDIKVGTKFFITYTVTEMESDASVQSGVAITQGTEAEYPDQNGTLFYRQGSEILNVGTTYFYRFEMTEKGLKCIASWAKGEESDYIGFPLTSGTIQTGCKHFGVWFGGTGATNMVGRLTRVRCYDENGKDLGITLKGGWSKGSVYDPAEREALKPTTKVKQKYSFKVEDDFNLLISNKKYTEEQIVYMEYTVKSVTMDNLTQAGFAYNRYPHVLYPEGVFAMEDYEVENYKGSDLLIPGMTYIVRYKLAEDTFEALVKYNLNGKDVYKTFTQKVEGNVDDCGFFTLFFGSGREVKMSAEFVDVKCYDKDGNNLGIRTNKSSIDIVCEGGLEDYSQCVGAYYNKEKDSIIYLSEENIISIVTGENTTAGSYIVEGSKLTANIGENTTEYFYVYTYMQDSEGNKYTRLKDNKVRFVSGVLTGEELTEALATADTAYRVSEPETPVMEGNTFVAWCYADGTEFDFDTVITEATTLYAKWQDGDGNVFLAVDAESKGIDVKWFIIGGSCLLLVATAVTGSVFILRRKQKVT